MIKGWVGSGAGRYYRDWSGGFNGNYWPDVFVILVFLPQRTRRARREEFFIWNDHHGGRYVNHGIEYRHDQTDL